MGYVDLGSRVAYGQADPTGQNLGNWSVVCDSAILDCDVPYFEIYRMIVTGAPNCTFTIYKGARLWDGPQWGQYNVWNGQLQLTPGQTIYYYFNDVDTDGYQPTVTLWMRYDTSIPANMSVKLGYGR